MTRLIAALAVVAFSTLSNACLAQDKKDETPRAIFSNPLAVSPGQTVTLQLRGLKLENADRVEAPGIEPALEIALKKKEKVGVPNQMTPDQVGDTQVEIELKVPETFAADVLPLIVHTPSGSSEPYKLLVLKSDLLVAEVEPNDAFARPQVVEPGKTIQGIIQEKNPEVFQVTGKAGQKLVAEVVADRQGSRMDGILSLFDASGALLARVDDLPETADPLITLPLPADGAYSIVLQDAHDRGGNTHPYLLRLRFE